MGEVLLGPRTVLSSEGEGNRLGPSKSDREKVLSQKLSTDWIAQGMVRLCTHLICCTSVRITISIV